MITTTIPKYHFKSINNMSGQVAICHPIQILIGEDWDFKMLVYFHKGF